MEQSSEFVLSFAPHHFGQVIDGLSACERSLALQSPSFASTQIARNKHLGALPFCLPFDRLYPTPSEPHRTDPIQLRARPFGAREDTSHERSAEDSCAI